MIVIQKLIRTYRHTPGIIGQLSKAVAVGLGIVPGITLHILMDIQCTFVSAVAAVGKLLDSLTSSIHFSLHVVKLSVAFCIDHQVVTLKAGVIDHIVPAVYASRMAGLGIVDSHKQCIIGICRLVTLPVGSLYQMVGLIIDKCSGLLLAGFSDPVASLIILVSISLVLAIRAFYKLVQLIVLVINRFVFDFFVYQIAKSIIGVSGLCLGDIAGRLWTLCKSLQYLQVSVNAVVVEARIPRL